MSALSLLLCAALASAGVSGQWVDLTRPAEPAALAKPKPSLSFVHPATFETRLETALMVDQTAPSVDQLTPDQLTGPAVVIDARSWCATRPDCQVMRSDIEEVERLSGPIPEGAIVMIETGFSRYWGDRARYLGLDPERNDGRPHFPGLHPSAAEWLAENRSPKLVVIDSPSVDYGPSKLYETHRALFAKGIPVLENAADLSVIPQRGAYAVVAPAKIKGAAFAPARLWVLVDPVR